MSRPIVLCGLGRMGARLLEHLLRAGMPVTVIDTVCQSDDPRLVGVKFVRGDCRRREVLEQADVVNARGVLILTADDLLNVSTALMVRGMNKEVRIVVRMFNQNLLARLGKAVSNVFALSTSLLTAPIVAMTALTGQALGTFRIHEGPAGLRQMLEITLTPESSLVGKVIGMVNTTRDLTIISHTKPDGTDRILLDVDEKAVLEVGDQVVVYGTPAQLTPLVSDDPNDVRKMPWGSRISRVARAVWRIVLEMDRAVLVCLAILVILLTISTLVLRYGVTKYSFADAFLRSVSVMATAAGFSEADYPDAPIVRVFVSILRIVGAILLAALTAIMTNYLVRAGLGGVFELRRVPEEGHIVVCGLSPVGFRVVEELMQQGERVVVIDQDPTQRFLATVRRLGAVVVIGDASLLEVLKQANTHTAKAIVAATNNDMTNLEVALLVREQNSDVRVVLLLNDPQFAQMLRDAAGIRLAVSVPALAAPAFLAGLFGDRVVSVFLLHDQLYAVLDLVIQAQDPFVGQTLRSISIDYRMRPLLHLQNDKQLSGERLIDRVGVGDRVLAMLSLSDMERLSRRQPCSAEYSVEVRSFPITSRAYLLGIVRMVQDSNQSEAEQWLKELPGTLQEGLTRGQAEELLGQLQRERVVAHMVRLNTEDANAPAAAN